MTLAIKEAADAAFAKVRSKNNLYDCRLVAEAIFPAQQEEGKPRVERFTGPVQFEDDVVRLKIIEGAPTVIIVNDAGFNEPIAEGGAIEQMVLATIDRVNRGLAAVFTGPKPRREWSPFKRVSLYLPGNHYQEAETILKTLSAQFEEGDKKSTWQDLMFDFPDPFTTVVHTARSRLGVWYQIADLDISQGPPRGEDPVGFWAAVRAAMDPRINFENPMDLQVLQEQLAGIIAQAMQVYDETYLQTLIGMASSWRKTRRLAVNRLPERVLKTVDQSLGEPAIALSLGGHSVDPSNNTSYFDPFVGQTTVHIHQVEEDRPRHGQHHEGRNNDRHGKPRRNK